MPKAARSSATQSARTARLTAALCLALASGCPVDTSSLTVRVQSGFRAQHEVARLEVTMAPGSSCEEATASPRIERRDVVASDQAALGEGTLTVATFEGLAAGIYTIRVTALRPQGGGLAELLARCAVVALTNDRIVRIPLTTDCAAVACPGDGTSTFTECVGGRCVDPRCDLEDPSTAEHCCDRATHGELCGLDPSFCSDAADCAAPLACSGPRRCAHGICVEPDEDLCPGDAFCSARSGGCEPFSTTTDAGTPDASVVEGDGPLEDLPDAATELDATPDLDAPVPDDARALDAPRSPDAAASSDATTSIDAPRDAFRGPDSCAGVCTPGAVGTSTCGMCGSRSRTCRSDCTWGSYGSCTGEGACSPGAVGSGSCGMCGTRSRTCRSDCTWGSYGACSGEGVCSPGARSSRACGCSGTQTRTCSSSCSWGSYGACTGETASCTDSSGNRICAGDRGYLDCTPDTERLCLCSTAGTWTACSACVPI